MFQEDSGDVNDWVVWLQSKAIPHTIPINTPLTSMDRSSGQKINKETVALNDTMDQ